MGVIRFNDLELQVNNNYEEDDIDYDDFFNIKKTRNAKNTDTEFYNCGGYAFETFSWYSPFNVNFDERCEEIEDFLSGGGSLEDAFEIFLQSDTETMLQDFEGRIRVVEDENSFVADNEILIAYRLRIIPYYDDDEFTIDHDFHYLVRDKNGWRHKQGRLLPEFIEFTKDPWSNGYDGPIVFFAFQN